MTENHYWCLLQLFKKKVLSECLWRWDIFMMASIYCDIHCACVCTLSHSLQVQIPISHQSHIVQHIILDADCPYLKFETTVSPSLSPIHSNSYIVGHIIIIKVEWHESHQFLKVEFPLNVRSHEATYEIQFGHLRRPTHFNTSWDQARFEVIFTHLLKYTFEVRIHVCVIMYITGVCSEVGRSVRAWIWGCHIEWLQVWLLYSLQRDEIITVRLYYFRHFICYPTNKSLIRRLRSPKAPDANADMGIHHFTYAILPHTGEV